MLTQEELKRHLFYCPEQGTFTRRVHICATKKVGNKRKDGYLQITVNGVKYLTHRLAFLYITGRFPLEEIDHKDRCKTNNKWNNLRECTKSLNRANMPCTKRNKLTIRGVYKLGGRSKRYQAQIKKDGKTYRLGNYLTIEEAKEAFLKAYKEMYGDFCRLD
jgi:hypothetical protein